MSLKKNESINQKIDVYTEYIRKGKTFANLITFLNANSGITYDLFFSESVALAASAGVPTNVSKIIAVRGGTITGAYTLTLSGQYIEAQKDIKIFDSTITLAGTIANMAVYPEWFGAVADGSTDCYASFTAAISFCANETKNTLLKLSSGVYLTTDTIRLKRGLTMSGINYDPNYGTSFKLDDNADCDVFDTIGTTFNQHIELSDFNIDGNKTNQTTGGHGFNLFQWDVANKLKRIRVADCKKNGFYFDNDTGVGTVSIEECLAVRCDEGGYKIDGPVNNMTLYKCLSEKSGLDVTGCYVIKDINDESIINFIGCRAEGLALADGGGLYHVDVINANAGVVNLDGCCFQKGATGIITDSIKITTSTAYINIKNLSNNLTSEPIINDAVRSTTYIPSSTKIKEICWNTISTDTGTSSNLEAFRRILNSEGGEFYFTSSSATPEGAVTAPTGSIHFRRSAGVLSDLYIKISGAGNTGWLPIGGWDSNQSFSDGDTTPDITGAKYFTTANTAPTSITDFDGGLQRQEIVVIANDANTTINATATIKLNGSANISLTQYSTITFIQFGSVWLEKSRSIV